MIVVNTYTLGRDGKNFSIDFKKPKQKNIPITQEWYDEMMMIPDENGDPKPDGWKKTGLYMEILEKETEEWRKKFDDKQVRMRQMKDIEMAKSSDILGKAIANTLKITTPVLTMPEGIPDSTWKEDDIKTWLKDKNISFGGRSGKEVLLQKVEENK